VSICVIREIRVSAEAAQKTLHLPKEI